MADRGVHTNIQMELAFPKCSRGDMFQISTEYDGIQTENGYKPAA
jgi:hypothetical protein